MPWLNLPALQPTPVTHNPLNSGPLSSSPLSSSPLSSSVVPDLVTPANAAPPRRDYPAMLSFEVTSYGPGSADPMPELRSPSVDQALSDKFDIELAVPSATIITMRGRRQRKDGRIHTDSSPKLLTARLHFNDHGQPQGGSLRRSDNLTDTIAGVPRGFGTRVAFRRSDCWFHGHEPFVRHPPPRHNQLDRQHLRRQTGATDTSFAAVCTTRSLIVGIPSDPASPPPRNAHPPVFQRQLLKPPEDHTDVRHHD
jgi:SM-20-related protein